MKLSLKGALGFLFSGSAAEDEPLPRNESMFDIFAHSHAVAMKGILDQDDNGSSKEETLLYLLDRYGKAAELCGLRPNDPFLLYYRSGIVNMFQKAGFGEPEDKSFDVASNAKAFAAQAVKLAILDVRSQGVPFLPQIKEARDALFYATERDPGSFKPSV